MSGRTSLATFRTIQIECPNYSIFPNWNDCFREAVTFGETTVTHMQVDRVNSIQLKDRRHCRYHISLVPIRLSYQEVITSFSGLPVLWPFGFVFKDLKRNDTSHSQCSGMGMCFAAAGGGNDGPLCFVGTNHQEPDGVVAGWMLRSSNAGRKRNLGEVQLLQKQRACAEVMHGLIVLSC